MRIGLLQFAPRPRDVRANLDHIAGALSKVRADLVVLPELCTTGYLFASRSELARLSEPVPDGPTCEAMARLSRDMKAALVWGMPVQTGQRIFNSAVMVTPQGEFHVYHKAHLFVDEKDLFDRGDSPFPVFDLGPAKVGMLVCFDHFFPEAARSLALHGAQIICHPSNLVLEYAQSNSITRAVENRVFWILANRTGSETLGEKTLTFNGRSQIVAPDGRLLGRAGPDSVELLIAEIDPAEALDKKVTPRNDLFLDRRTDLYSA
jgi:predicted amidohydrolase